MVKVSVIVPLVNREAPPARLVGSLLRQTLEDFEVILVGAGASACQDRDEKIKVIESPNGSRGAAFNRGLESALGEYIYFLEVRDEVEAELLTDNLRIAEENDTDLVVFGQAQYDLPTRRDFRIHFGEFYQWTPDGLGDKLYKREFLTRHKIRFADQEGGEEALFNLSVYREIESVFFNSKDYHHRRKRKETYRPMQFESDYAVARALEELIFYWGLEKEYQFLIHKGYWLAVYKELKRLSRKDCPLTHSEKIKRLKKIMNDVKISESLIALEKHSTLSSFSKCIVKLLQRNKFNRVMLLFKIKLS